MANSGKFQFIVLGFNNMAPFKSNINCKIIPCSIEVKLLGIIDNELKLIKHIDDLCRKHLLNLMPETTLNI